MPNFTSMKNTTIKDIASLAGVSVSTVSRALKDHPDIGAELRHKIKLIAQEFNYHPNRMAVNLRKQQSGTIGLVLPHILNFFFPSVINGISEVLQNAGYQLLILQSGESLQREIENIRICYENRVDGLLITFTNQTSHPNHLDQFKEENIPIVLLDKSLENSGFDDVTIDDIEAANTCTQYLIHTGAKKVMGVFGNPNLMITAKRLKGFLKVIEDHSSNGVTAQYHFVDSTPEAKACIEQNYHLFQPDAVFAMTDEVLAGAIPALLKLNVEIPTQCAVLGFSDGYLPSILTPEVSYLHHDGFALGQLAATHLLKRINNKQKINHPPTQLQLKTKLVINQSTN